MNFKCNFIQCNILTQETPPPNVTFVTIFFAGVPYGHTHRQTQQHSLL